MRVNQVAAEFRKVSNKQMAETTKRTIRENVSINSQLAKMSDKTTDLITENDTLRKKEKDGKQQIDVLEYNEKELAKKNLSNQKVSHPICIPILSEILSDNSNADGQMQSSGRRNWRIRTKRSRRS